MAKEIGNIDDYRCSQSSAKLIGKDTCRNECSFCEPVGYVMRGQNHDKKKIVRTCTLNYWPNNKLPADLVRF